MAELRQSFSMTSMGDIARVGFQHWADVLPVAEDDLRPRPGSEHLGVREFDWLGLL